MECISQSKIAEHVLPNIEVNNTDACSCNRVSFSDAICPGSIVGAKLGANVAFMAIKNARRSDDRARGS